MSTQIGDNDRAFEVEPAHDNRYALVFLAHQVLHRHLAVLEPRISDLAVVPYRQASRRALISWAPTQGTPPRRVTPCG